MADVRKPLKVVLVLAGLATAVLLALWAAYSAGVFPFVYTRASTPRELLAFLESSRADVKGIRVNGHHLEIGKRPSLQVVRGYGRIMYQMRPYRKVNLKYRNFTMAEVVDFCTTITGQGYGHLRSSVESGSVQAPAWAGVVKGRKIVLTHVTNFTYLVVGPTDRPLFMGQVELAKHLGMTDERVLAVLIPVQDRWLEMLRAGSVIDAVYPVQPAGVVQDELIAWIEGSAGQAESKKP